jgi:hypothetical protein
VVRSEIDPLIAQLPAYRDVQMIDTYTPLKESRNLLQADGVHFTIAGARLVAEIVGAMILGMRGTPDFTGDGKVDIQDLLLVIEHWGQAEPTLDIAPPPFGDGMVDAADLEVFMRYWGQEILNPPPIARWKFDEIEGMVYTCVGKHPEYSVTAYGLAPDAERISDLIGYLVRTGANTFRFSVICHGTKGGGPEAMGLSEILYMATLTGTAELVDSQTMVIHNFTFAAYMPAADLDGNRLPDEGAQPVICSALPQVSFNRLPMFPSCEPTPMR